MRGDVAHRNDRVRAMKSAAVGHLADRDVEPTGEIGLVSGVYILQAARMVGTSTASIRSVFNPRIGRSRLFNLP